MSLRVWLPLNGDLTNNGLSNVTVTNNGATVDNNGKIGKCYSFDGTNDYLNITGYTNFGDEFSVSFWLYSGVASQSSIVICSRAVTYGGLMVFLSDGTLCIDSAPNSPSVRTRWTTSFTLTENVWYHFIIVRKPTELLYYVNGEFKQSKIVDYGDNYGNTLTLGCINTNGSSYKQFFNGKFNDFRIYDHALSAKEVKELSKGLVCHYKLDNSGFGNDNVLTNSTGYEGISNWNGVIESNIEDGHPFLITKRTNTTSSSRTFITHYAITSFVSNWSAGTKFTISGYYKVPSSENYDVTAKLFIRWNRKVGESAYNDTGFSTPSNVEKDKWIRFENTYSVPTEYEDGAVTFYLSAFSKGLSTVYWKNVKLELGDKATSWIPNANDELYEKLKLNNNIVYDCSGYNYHGTPTGNLTVSSDSARNSLSTVFDGTSRIELDNGLPMEVKSISIWLKTSYETVSSSQVVFHDKNTRLALGFYTNNRFITYASSSGSGGSGSCVLTTNKYIANQWNHIVIIKTGDNTRDVYINNEKMTPTTNNAWTVNTNKFIIGNRYNGSYNAPFSGQISDFRAYVTALSTDDIKELYQVGASIDKDGNVFAYEFKED